MRHRHYEMQGAEALSLLARAEVVRLATTLEDGTLVLRTLHGVLLEDGLYFHGAPTGEKAGTVGRRAVAAAEELVASIPSYFIDPERACPATTYYRSVQAHGVLEEVRDPERKAQVLGALMAHRQPEGGYAPISAADPRYRGAVAGLMVTRLRLERVEGKAKLGQNRTPAQRVQVLERLWQRGGPRDPAAIDAVREGNLDTPTPPFLTAPAGATLLCAPGPEWISAARALLAGQYWTGALPEEASAGPLGGSTGWVAAHDRERRLIGMARFLSDGARWAGLFDVTVADDWRGRGLGSALVRLALDHPSVRGALRVWLRTRDAQDFYSRLGFVPASQVPGPAFASEEMLLERAR